MVKSFIPKFNEIDLRAIPYILRMNQHGIRLDPSRLEPLSHTFSIKMEDAQLGAWREARTSFNLGSHQQVADVLFNKLKLPVGRRTSTGYSVDSDVLETLKSSHPSVPYILEYKRCQKLKSTYVDGLPRHMGSDGRIRARWQGTRVSSGRLSCADPNLQNQPVRDEEGILVRKAFVPDPGFKFVAVDFSQIELRVLAYMSKDPKMLEVFRSGGDIHTSTAAEVYRVSPESVTKTQRYISKTLNFGVIYGITPIGLLMNIPMDSRDPTVHTTHWAAAFIKRYFLLYRGAREFIDRILEFVRRNGYVEDMFGRRRYIPECQSSNRKIRAMGDREAQNHPMQAGAGGGIMKLAMGELVMLQGKGVLDGWIKEGVVKTPLQIHDELVLEVKDQGGFLMEVASVVKNIMEGVAPWMEIPIKVDVEMGDSWGSLEKVKV